MKNVNCSRNHASQGIDYQFLQLYTKLTVSISLRLDPKADGSNCFNFFQE